MSSNAVVSISHTQTSPSANSVSFALSPFDRQHYQELIGARADTIKSVLSRIKDLFSLKTAVDAGAGVGFFSQTLHECGLDVCGFDGRTENVSEARKRYPHIPFEQGDIQDPSILVLGKFDLTLCFGLLYHLENPLLAIRHLRALTRKCLLLESMCIPGTLPSMLLREEPKEGDQSLSDVAYYPSEGSLVKMLYRAGFGYVYRLLLLPDHDDFRETSEHRRKRTVLFASVAPTDLFGFRLCVEAHETDDPWSKRAVTGRLDRFMSLPTGRKYAALAHRARRAFPRMPIPWRLPFGAWWLAQDGELDHKLLYERFEAAELTFVANILQPGMTVLDIGAHHGLYSLLCSKCVGRNGLVIAFEASPRECGRLARHVGLNRCANVHIEPCAVGSEHDFADLFVVDGACDWGNSLRAPVVKEPTYKVRVEVRAVDDVLLGLGISKVDFVKLDVEGAELSVLQGATRLLRAHSRPAILVEVQELRTQPWGYPSRAIVDFLTDLNFRWFSVAGDGALQPVSNLLDSYDANLVALPSERTREFRSLAERGSALRGKKTRRVTSRSRGIEILKSMVRVRRDHAEP